MNTTFVITFKHYFESFPSQGETIAFDVRLPMQLHYVASRLIGISSYRRIYNQQGECIGVDGNRVFLEGGVLEPGFGDLSLKPVVIDAEAPNVKQLISTAISDILWSHNPDIFSDSFRYSRYTEDHYEAMDEQVYSPLTTLLFAASFSPSVFDRIKTGSTIWFIPQWKLMQALTDAEFERLVSSDRGYFVADIFITPDSGLNETLKLSLARTSLRS